MSQEYIVRVPREIKKQFHVMRFSAALNMDVAKFKNCKMERESLFKEVKEELEEVPPEFGAGSEYGRKEREEARRRKYEKRKNKTNNSPWVLKVGGKQGKKYKGIREGGVTENTSYYVFFQAPDGAFEAFPVNEWYNFAPFQRYKAMSAEEAEEKFNKRDQILNYFPLRLMGKKEGGGDNDESGKKSDRSIKKEFKVSDMDDWCNSDNNLSDDSGSDDDEKKPKNSKNKTKKDKKEKKKKKKNDSDDEENPLEESDEGDYDDKEVDYMSDCSSSSESETDKSNIKGVEDESALRDLVVSEEEDEEEENKPENPEQTEENNANEAEKKIKVKSEKSNANDSSISDSDFDSDNSDLDDSKSALLIQTKKGQKVKSEQSEPGASEVKSSDANTNSATGSKSNGLKFKHKLEGSVTGHVSKKQKVQNESTDGISEESVRRYLMRKPMTCIDLLQKFKNKVHQRDNLVAIIVEILKKLNPEKQNIKGKMYFSLKPSK